MIETIFSGDCSDPRTLRGEYALMSGVFLVRLKDGTARLLDFGGAFYALSQTANSMLAEALQRDLSSAAITIAESYDVTPVQIRTDMEAFLHGLEKARVVSRAGTPPRVRRKREKLSCLFVAVAVTVIGRFSRVAPVSIWILLALACLSIRLLGWPATVAVWQRRWPLVVRPTATGSYPSDDPREIDDRLRNIAAAHIAKISCKERALVCWALLRMVGREAIIVVGLDLFPLSIHCWCVSEALVLSDYEDKCLRFHPVVFYPGIQPFGSIRNSV